MKDHADVIISVKVSKAQKRQLEKLFRETGRRPSELIREAIMALLGVYHGKTRTEDALAKTVDKGVVGGKH